jgi:hypothetical protein
MATDHATRAPEEHSPRTPLLLVGSVRFGSDSSKTLASDERGGHVLPDTQGLTRANMSLVYRWRVAPHYERDFDARVQKLIERLRTTHTHLSKGESIFGARLCQPVFGPRDDVWELWIDLEAELLHHLITADSSPFFELSQLALNYEQGADGKPVVELLDEQAPIYRVRSAPPVARGDQELTDRTTSVAPPL